MPGENLYIIPLRCYCAPFGLHNYHLGKVRQFYELAKQQGAMFRGFSKQKGLLEGSIEDLIAAAVPDIVSSAKNQHRASTYIENDSISPPHLLSIVGSQLIQIRKDHPNTLGYFIFQPSDQGHILLQTVIEAAAIATNFPLKIGRLPPPLLPSITSN